MDFTPKEVVWAKVKGYPWWPAYINKLPEASQGNFKVIFFAEDTYALLQPKCVQKFAENYAQHSKTKAKKFLKALQLANTTANRISNHHIEKSPCSNRKKNQKKQSQQFIAQSQDNEMQDSSSIKNQQSDSKMQHKSMEQLFDQSEQIDRKKVDKIENQLSQIITNFQNNRIKDWKYGKYFQQFNSEYDLKSEQILHSNLTRKIRFIIQNMHNNKIEQRQIDKMETLSEFLKNKVLNYLTDTSYYDKHLKLIDKSRQNKVQTQSQIVKIMKKRCNGQIKKQFINILALQIGGQVGKNSKFRAKQFIADLKEGAYDSTFKTINSKAATQRLADQLIIRYRQ